MGTNFHTAPSATPYTAAAWEAILSTLDRGVTYLKNIMVGGGGTITWAAGTLTWGATLNVFFNASDGKACHNTIAASNIALADDEFAYVTLSETNDAAVTVSKAAIGDGSASGFLAYNILVLGKRDGTAFFATGPFAACLNSTSYLSATLFDAYTVLYADTDNTPAALTVPASTVVGRKSTGGIAALTAADLRTLLGNLDGRSQSITCADSVTVDWSLGATSYMTYDRGTVAFTLSNPSEGGVYRLILTQGDGSDLAIWTTTVKWSGGAAPVLSAAAGAIDIVTFVYANSMWYGSATLNFAAA